MVAWYWLIGAVVVGLLSGLTLYHWVLGSSGYLAGKAADAVENRLNKVGKTILGIEHKVDRGFGLRKRG